MNRTGRRRQAWFRSYVATILQREVRELAAVEGLHTMPRLLELLAVRAGSLLNFAEISRTTAIPQTTLKRYLALLENTFLVHRLPAWARNPSKHLVKSPKLFFNDTGLLGHLAGWTVEGLSRHPEAAGPLLENFVSVELIKQAGWSRTACRLFHFQTTTGREVDLVLERDDGRVVGIEVKARVSIAERDFQGLKTLQESCGRSFQRGVVLYTGSQRLSFGPRLYALPVSSLWQLGAPASAGG